MPKKSAGLTPSITYMNKISGLSNKHSQHSSASLQKPNRQSNNPINSQELCHKLKSKSKSPNQNSDGGGTMRNFNLSHYKTISKDSQSMKMLESVLPHSNTDSAPGGIKKIDKNSSKSSKLLSGGLYEKARNKILMTKMRKN